LAKVVIIGDSGVGKTKMMTKYCEGVFKESYVATIGVDFKLKDIKIGDLQIRLQIWDTAGQ
jgi:small GTP-binding protein